MKPGTLPTENAFEPEERAHQPMEDAMTPRVERQMSRKIITFAEDTDPGDKPSSQRSTSYKEVLSQPAPGLTQKQKLLWLQQRRSQGLYAQCDDCNQWRYLPHVLDSYELPTKWYCRMNPDKSNADCSIPEAPIRLRDEEDLIHSEYSAGSVVWAKMAGFPWWPAMVDDCPDTEQFYWLDGFSDIPTHYNVVFFDSVDVTRAWVAGDNLKSYAANKKCYIPYLKDIKYKHRLKTAVNQADDATKLSLADRLQKYSFLAKYKGEINAPKKLTKKDLARHAKYLKRKFNIHIETDSEEEEWRPKSIKHKNMIVLGTHKKPRTKIGQGKNVETKIQDQNLEPVSENQEKVETENTGPLVNGLFKEPSSSLAVQKGSNANSLATESLDNDTSKTYVPEKGTDQTTLCTVTNTVSSEITEFQVRIATPSSDDFDF